MTEAIAILDRQDAYYMISDSGNIFLAMSYVVGGYLSATDEKKTVAEEASQKQAAALLQMFDPKMLDLQEKPFRAEHRLTKWVWKFTEEKDRQKAEAVKMFFDEANAFIDALIELAKTECRFPEISDQANGRHRILECSAVTHDKIMARMEALLEISFDGLAVINGHRPVWADHYTPTRPPLRTSQHNTALNGASAS